MNPNDAIRDAILRHLYAHHQKAKSPKSAAIGVRDLQAEMKAQGFKQQVVASNLDYLVQKGWVREVIEARTFTTPRGTTQTAERRTYKISDIGIDKLEAASTYQRDVADRVNITNIKGVTVVGSGNVVNLEFTDLSDALDELRNEVLSSDGVSDEEKLNLAADIDALQSQLQKPEPNRGVVKSLWEGIEKAANVAGASELAVRAGQLLTQLLT
jgi:hypothetical protein